MNMLHCIYIPTITITADMTIGNARNKMPSTSLFRGFLTPGFVIGNRLLSKVMHTFANAHVIEHEVQLRRSE